MSDHDSPSSAAELIADLRRYGLTQTEIARELGRSTRMVRAVERGDKPGGMYVDALRQLWETGRSPGPVPRRRGAAGGVVPVRAKRDSGEPSVVPEDPTNRTQGRRDFHSETVYMGTGRQYHVAAPRSEGIGREKGREELMRGVRSGARGRRRVKFEAVYENGVSVQIGAKGGYVASDVLRRWHGEGDDPYAWLSAERGDEYAARTRGSRMVDVVMTVY